MTAENRDELAEAIRTAVVEWNSLGRRKVGGDVSQFIADRLIADGVGR